MVGEPREEETLTDSTMEKQNVWRGFTYDEIAKEKDQSIMCVFVRRVCLFAQRGHCFG